MKYCKIEGTTLTISIPMVIARIKKNVLIELWMFTDFEYEESRVRNEENEEQLQIVIHFPEEGRYIEYRSKDVEDLIEKKMRSYNAKENT